MIINDEELIEEWKRYFEELLNITQKETHEEKKYLTADMPFIEPSFEETQKTLNKLKNHKTPGTDEIPAEFKPLY